MNDIRQLLADVLWNAWLETGVEPDRQYCLETADALLASLCDEIERLRAIDEVRRLDIIFLTTEIERLQHQEHIALNLNLTRKMERDAALAECERLRKSRADLFEHEQEKWHRIAQAQADALDAWRACADQLDAALSDHKGTGDRDAEARAEYERLKASE